MSNKPLKIYNASAGSGKTYTLVQEYLRIILNNKNPLKFRNIIAMTFTNKAASEMKERILDSLILLKIPFEKKSVSELEFLAATAKNLKLSPQLIEARANIILNKILHNYGSFSVMTIDKFTHKIIRTFAKDLNLSIDFDVELDIKQLRKSVTDLMFDQIGRDKELSKLMLNYAQTNLAEDKSWNFSEQLFKFSDEVFKENAINAIEKLKKLSSEDFLSIQKSLTADVKKFENEIARNGQEALDLAKSKGLDFEDFKGKGSSVLGFFTKMVASDYKNQPSNTNIKNVGNNDITHPKSPNLSTATEIAPLLIQYFNQIVELLETGQPHYILNRKKLKNLNNLSLLKYILEMVEQIKEDENILLITDFYKKISEIIIEEPVPFIYERLGVRYENFLLDEFQDTSHLQWINMIPLVHNSLASAQTNLIVGDGKQAIYRWRNGEVEQFTGLPNKIYNPQNIATLNEAAPLFENLGERLPLNENYRSAPEIVEFNNSFFSHVAEGLDPSLKIIYNDIKQTPTKKFKGYVEAFIKPKLTEEEQLNYISKVVRESISKGYLLSDICILAYRKAPGAIIARHLAEQGFNVISSESLFISKDNSVKFLTSIIGAIVYPNQSNFKIKALEHYANIFTKKDPREIIPAERDALYNRSIQQIFGGLGYEIKLPTAFHNMYEFVDALIATFEFDLNQNPYLQTLAEQVHVYERNNSSSLRDFIDWYYDMGNEKSIISPDGADAITVMTIHKSKGLQFPIVICANFDWQMSLDKQIAWVEETDKKLPAYFLNMTKDLESTNQSALFETEQAKFNLDNINLLYVAFTRAEHGLFIIGDAEKRQSPAKTWIQPYVSAPPLGQIEGDYYKYGSFEEKHEKTSTHIANYEVKPISKKMDKPTLSFRSAETWDIHHLDEKRMFGSKVHLILSKISSLADLPQQLDAALKKGIILPTEVDAIKDQINSLFEDNHFATYFDDVEVLNEQEFITEMGKILIPDKIIIRPESTKIIDFKTGQESPKHIEQLLQYIDLVKSVGYPEVSGEIYYTESKKVVAV